MGRLLGILRALGASWGNLRQNFWGRPGASCGILGAFWAHLRQVMEAPRGVLEDLGAILDGLETSWGGFVTVWDGLEASWGSLGAVLD